MSNPAPDPPEAPEAPATPGSPSAPPPKPWEHNAAGRGSASDDLAARFVQSLSHDRRLFRHDIRGSIAHARMLHGVGLIGADDLSAIERGLAEIEAEILRDGEAWPGWRVEYEDVHMCVEAALIAKVGEPGRKLHTGRSRNDQVALDLKLWVEEATGELNERFDALLRALLDLARRDGDIVMPGYTHLQRAQPILVGAELIAWMEAFDRCARRMLTIRTVLPRNPLGSGALAGSALPLDREALARSLPLGGPTLSAIDATTNRDAALDFVYPLAMTAMTLSRWAEQWVLYCTTEFGFLALDPRYTTGSSMMPQKRNPDMLELIRGRTGGVYGHLLALLTICKGLPLGYNRDVQEDKRHVFEAYDTVMDCLDMARRIVSTARFNRQKIESSLGPGFLDATSLAEYLVTRGVPFRTAHQVVGSLVLTCERRGLDRLSMLTLDDFNAACRAAGQPGDVCEASIHDWLEPANVVRRYRTFGNAGTLGLDQGLAAWSNRLRT